MIMPHKLRATLTRRAVRRDQRSWINLEPDGRIVCDIRGWLMTGDMAGAAEQQAALFAARVSPRIGEDRGKAGP